MASDQITYDLKGDSKDLVSALKDAEKSFGSLSAASKKSAGDIEGEQKKVKKSTASMGQQFTDLAFDPLAAISKVSPEVAALGTSVAAVTATVAVFAAGFIAAAAAAAGLAYGLYEVTRAGQEAVQNLDEMGQSEYVSVDQRLQIEKANASLDALGVQFDRFVALLAADVAPTVIEVSQGLLSLAIQANDVFETFTSTGDALEWFANTVLKSLTLGISGPAIALDEFSLKALAASDDLGSMQPVIQTVSDALSGLLDLLKVFDAQDNLGQGRIDTLSKEGELTKEISDHRRELTSVSKKLADAEKATSDLRSAAAAKIKKDEEDAKKLADAKAKGIEAHRKELEDQKKAADEAAKAQQAGASAYIKLLAEIGAEGQKAAESLMTAEEKLQSSYDDTLTKIEAKKQEGIAAAQAAGGTYEEIAERVGDIQIAAAEAVLIRTKELEADKQSLYEDTAQKAADEAQKAADAQKAIDDAAAEEAATKAAEALQLQKDTNAARLDAAIALWDALTELAQQFFDADVERHQAELDRMDARKAYLKDNLSQMTSDYEDHKDSMSRADQLAAMDAIAAEKARIKTVNENIKKEEAAKQAAMTRAFRLQQLASLASIGMSTALAIMAALAPPPIGYGPVAGIPAGILIGGLGAAQAAGVLTQKPPELHAGGVVDEVQRTLLTGEGVANRTAMANPEFVAHQNAANRGQTYTPNQGQQAVYWNDRLLMQISTRNAKLGSSQMPSARLGTATHYSKRSR